MLFILKRTACEELRRISAASATDNSSRGLLSTRWTDHLLHEAERTCHYYPVSFVLCCYLSARVLFTQEPRGWTSGRADPAVRLTRWRQVGWGSLTPSTPSPQGSDSQWLESSHNDTHHILAIKPMKSLPTLRCVIQIRFDCIYNLFLSKYFYLLKPGWLKLGIEFFFNYSHFVLEKCSAAERIH